MREVAAGLAQTMDGVVTDDTILAGMEAQDTNTKIVGGSLAPEPYGIAFPKQNTDFVKFVNGVLGRVLRDAVQLRVAV